MLLAPLRATADLSFYRGVPGRSGAWLLGYSAYLGVLFAIAGTIAMWIRVAPVLEETIEWAVRSIPTLTFAGGKVTSPVPGPVRVQHPSLPAFAVVIDTQRETAVTIEEIQKQKARAYLTRNMLFLLSDPDRMEPHELAKAGGHGSPTVVLDETFYRSVGEMLPRVLYPLVFVTGWAFFVAWTLLAACTYSLAAIVLNGALGAELEYPALWKLSLVAQTPAVMLKIAHLFLPAPIGLFWLLGFLVVGVYLWHAIRQHVPQDRTDTAESV